MASALTLAAAARAGVFIGCVEAAVLLAAEPALTAQVGLSVAAVGLVVALGVLGCVAIAGLGLGVFSPWLRSARAATLVPVGAFLLSAIAMGMVAVVLTGGPRARLLPYRGWLVASGALLAGLGSAACAALVRRALGSGSDRGRRALGALLLAAATGCLLLDARVLLRLYPVFHYTLLALGLGSAVLGALLLRVPDLSCGAAVSLVCAALLASAFAVVLTPGHPALFLVRSRAPFAGKLLHIASHLHAGAGRVVPGDGAPPPALPPGQLVFPSRDLLLVTIDALRADRLDEPRYAAVTPQLRALQRDAVSFARAYSVAPNSSHALASLMLSRFTELDLARGAPLAAQHSLAAVLRRAGYATFASYPWKVFAVELHRFRALHRAQLGFEHTAHASEDAATLAAGLRGFIAGQAAGRPLFAWVHLTHPHGPYVRNAHTRGERPQDLYDGEVALADWIAAELVGLFRQARPQATVVVSADHGEEFLDHGGYWHGSSLYEEQVRVPLIVSVPGLRAARVASPVSLVDLPTTLLPALGVAAPRSMQGQDLRRLLAGGAGTFDVPVFSAVGQRRALWRSPLKVICDLAIADCELYDLSRDPLERVNVAWERPRELQALRGQLGGFLAWQARGGPRPLSRVRAQ